jgi:DNA-directed RNA polymerase subunit RPC12/RpoP
LVVSQYMQPRTKAKWIVFTNRVKARLLVFRGQYLKRRYEFRRGFSQPEAGIDICAKCGRTVKEGKSSKVNEMIFCTKCINKVFNGRRYVNKRESSRTG